VKPLSFTLRLRLLAPCFAAGLAACAGPAPGVGEEQATLSASTSAPPDCPSNRVPVDVDGHLACLDGAEAVRLHVAGKRPGTRPGDVAKSDPMPADGRYSSDPMPGGPDPDPPTAKSTAQTPTAAQAQAQTR
jgi:hypothetical protein